MPEYLKNRYKSTAIQLFMTIVALISYVFTKISVSFDNGYDKTKHRRMNKNERSH